MPKIRKKYEEIVSILEKNLDKKVSEVLEEIRPKLLTKPGGKIANFKLHSDGFIIAIFCSYHKKWEDPRVVHFGKKSTSSSGFTSSCLEGMNLSNRRRKDYKQGLYNILKMTEDSKTNVKHIKLAREKLESTLTQTFKRADDYGFEKIEDCIEHSKKLGLLV